MRQHDITTGATAAAVDQETLDHAIAVASRERPEIVRDVGVIIGAINIAAARRQRMDPRFLAHTTVLAHDSLRDGEAMTSENVANIVIAQWDDETAADRDERASAGV